MGKTKDTQNTREKILLAAREVFMEKGYAGSRMQEIAEAAGTNKGLLHYYFRNKDNLFREVFAEAAGKFVPRIQDLMESELSIREKVGGFIDQYFSLLRENPYLPAFIVTELNRHPEEILKRLPADTARPTLFSFVQQLLDAAEAGEIAPVQPFHLLMSTISLSVFPFLARPVFQYLVGLSPAQYEELLEQRRAEVKRIILSELEPPAL